MRYCFCFGLKDKNKSKNFINIIWTKESIIILNIAKSIITFVFN